MYHAPVACGELILTVLQISHSVFNGVFSAPSRPSPLPQLFHPGSISARFTTYRRHCFGRSIGCCLFHWKCRFLLSFGSVWNFAVSCHLMSLCHSVLSSPPLLPLPLACSLLVNSYLHCFFPPLSFLHLWIFCFSCPCA